MHDAPGRASANRAPTGAARSHVKSLAGYLAAAGIGLAAATAMFVALWGLTLIVEMHFASRATQSPLPPPHDLWLRGPTVGLAAGVGIWVLAARLGCLSIHRVLAGAGIIFVVIGLLAVGIVSPFDGQDTHTYQHHIGIRCGQDGQCRVRDTDGGWLTADTDTVLAAGDQACGWLADQPWGPAPPPASLREELAGDPMSVNYALYVRDLRLSRANPEERLQMEVATPAWKFLCPWQRHVHRQTNLVYQG